jgi:hypothetical protein
MTLLAFAATCAQAHAQDIKPYQAHEIKPYHAQELQPVRAEREPQRSPDRGTSDGQVSQLLGAWQSSVPGAVWTSPSAVPGWETLHVSAGALAGLLVIYPNGTYIWNSYGGKKGRWTRSNDPGYPIVLDDQSEHRQWKVGLDDRHADSIYIYDGNAIYYTAHRPR